MIEVFLTGLLSYLFSSFIVLIFYVFFIADHWTGSQRLIVVSLFWPAFLVRWLWRATIEEWKGDV